MRIINVCMRPKFFFFFWKFKKKWLNFNPLTSLSPLHRIYYISISQQLWVMIQFIVVPNFKHHFHTWIFQCNLYLCNHQSRSCQQFIQLDVSQFMIVAFNIYLTSIFQFSSNTCTSSKTHCVWAFDFATIKYYISMWTESVILNYPTVWWFNESVTENISGTRVNWPYWEYTRYAIHFNWYLCQREKRFPCFYPVCN